jgi:hypothetical protein
MGLMIRDLLQFDSYGLVFFCGASSLTRGLVCLLYMLLALPAQSFSDPSPLVLATASYCLRFETSFFVASYDSQGHGGGIRPRLHTSTSLTYKCFVPEPNEFCRLYSRGTDTYHRKHMSRDQYPPLRDITADTENTASSIACWTVFTELLPGNAFIKSVTV